MNADVGLTNEGHNDEANWQEATMPWRLINGRSIYVEFSAAVYFDVTMNCGDLVRIVSG